MGENNMHKLQSLLSVYISQARYKSSNSITSVRSSRHIRGHEHTSSLCVTSVGAAAERKAAHRDEVEVTWWLHKKWQESQYKLRIKVTLIEDLSYFEFKLFDLIPTINTICIILFTLRIRKNKALELLTEVPKVIV